MSKLVYVSVAIVAILWIVFGIVVVAGDSFVIYVMDENSNDFVELNVSGDNLTISGREECRGDMAGYFYGNLTNATKVIHVSGFLEE
jgi:hypothetical protein